MVVGTTYSYGGHERVTGSLRAQEVAEMLRIRWAGEAANSSVDTCLYSIPGRGDHGTGFAPPPSQVGPRMGEGQDYRSRH